MTDACTVKRFSLARIVRVAHWGAYSIWVGLLAARAALLVAALFILLVDVVITRAHAAAGNAREVQEILSNRPLGSVIEGRKLCVSGVRGQMMVALDKALAGNLSSGIADECIANLVRLGRERRLGFLANSDGSAPNAPLSLDTGFIAAYRKAERPPTDLPLVTALRPVAVRCLTQTERDKDLCYAVGYAYGVRAAHGETVVAF